MKTAPFAALLSLVFVSCAAVEDAPDASFGKQAVRNDSDAGDVETKANTVEFEAAYTLTATSTDGQTTEVPALGSSIAGGVVLAGMAPDGVLALSGTTLATTVTSGDRLVLVQDRLDQGLVSGAVGARVGEVLLSVLGCGQSAWATTVSTSDGSLAITKLALDGTVTQVTANPGEGGTIEPGEPTCVGKTPYLPLRITNGATLSTGGILGDSATSNVVLLAIDSLFMEGPAVAFTGAGVSVDALAGATDGAFAAFVTSESGGTFGGVSVEMGGCAIVVGFAGTLTARATFTACPILQARLAIESGSGAVAIAGVFHGTVTLGDVSVSTASDRKGGLAATIGADGAAWAITEEDVSFERVGFAAGGDVVFAGLSGTASTALGLEAPQGAAAPWIAVFDASHTLLRHAMFDGSGEARVVGFSATRSGGADDGARLVIERGCSLVVAGLDANGCAGATTPATLTEGSECYAGLMREARALDGDRFTTSLAPNVAFSVGTAEIPAEFPANRASIDRVVRLSASPVAACF